MGKYQVNRISGIFYRITGTGVIMILAVLIDWWLFKIFTNHRGIIYYLGIISFASVLIGFIVNIWKGFGKDPQN